jgi:hypothetical protein
MNQHIYEYFEHFSDLWLRFTPLHPMHQLKVYFDIVDTPQSSFNATEAVAPRYNTVAVCFHSG